MASPQQQKRDEFALQFNKIMAQHGKSVTNKSDAEFASTLPDMNNIIKAAQSRMHLNAIGKSTGSSSNKSSTSTLTPEEKTKFLAARDLELKAEENDRPWYKDIGHGALNVLNALDVPGAYVRSGVKELSDTIETSRVGHWLYDKMDYDPGEDGRTPSSGSWKDFTSQAKRHMGFGEMWADARGDDKNKWLDRAVGLAGDIALDPLTHAGSKVVTKASKETVEAVAARSGQAAGEAAAKATGKQAVKVAGRNTANAVADTIKGADEVFSKEAAERLALHEYIKAHPRRIDVKGYKAGVYGREELMRRVTTKYPNALLVNGPTGRVVMEEAVQAQINKVIFEVQKRSQAGKLIGNPTEIVEQVAHQVTEAAKRVLLKPLDDASRKLRMSLDPSNVHVNLSKADIAKLDNEVQYFSEWRTAIDQHFSLNNIVKPTESQLKAAYRYADGKIDDIVKLESDRIFALAKGTMDDSIEKIPTLKMFGKEVAEFPTLGRAGHKVAAFVAATPQGEALQKLFSYTSNFPGYSSLISQKSRALGVARYEAKRKEIIEFARGYSRAEARELHRMLERGDRGVGKMADGVKFLRRAYDDLLGEEIAAGVRDATPHSRVADYAYTHIYRKRKTAATIKKWNASRTGAAKATGTLNGFTTVDAIRSGFKVEHDGFKNLLYREMRANRKLTDSYFYRDLVTHYGFKGRVSELEKKGARDLVKVDSAKDADILKAMKLSLKDGEDLYISRDIANIHKNYTAISKEPDEIIRGLDYLTRKFKIMNTIYFPGYHVRNMIGDYFMGVMDGVKTRDYGTILNKWSRRTRANINVGGDTIKMQKFLQLYEENLGSGAFLSGELGNGLLKGRTIPSAARKASEGREDFGRIVHFYRALDDEFSALKRKGVPKERAWDEALNSAIFRVNKFKFDYSALTKTELSVMRRGIPFYTYMRKAIPTLMESLMLNPKYIATMNRLTSEAENRYDDTLLPDWMRELGYGKLTDGFGMSFNMLPTQTIKEMFSNPVDKANPLIQIPFEMQMGEDTFTHKPLNTTGVGALPEILANKWRGVGTIRDASATINDATGIELPGPFQEDLDASDKTTVEKVANFFGFPIKRVGVQEQEQALAEINYKLNGKMDALEAEVADLGYRVYFSNRNNGMSMRVRDETTGQVIFEAESIKELRQFVTAKRNGDI